MSAILHCLKALGNMWWMCHGWPIRATAGPYVPRVGLTENMDPCLASHMLPVHPATPSVRLGLHSKRRHSDKPGIKCRIKPAPMFALQMWCIRSNAGQGGSEQTSFNFSNITGCCLLKRRAWDVLSGKKRTLFIFLPFFFLPLYTFLYYLVFLFSPDNSHLLGP